MDRIENKEYTELASAKLDYDALDEWRDAEADGVPVCGFLRLYKACGLEEAIKAHCDAAGGPIAPADNLVCNLKTMMRLKSFIEGIWETYSIDIDADGHVFWDPLSKYGRLKHYPKKMKARVKASVLFDFANYCPGLDDSVPDDVISFRMERDEKREA